MGGIIDITGNRYGKLVVLGISHTKQKRSYWTCRCDCGTVAVLRKDDFCYPTSHQYSCGCERRRLSSERMLERHRRRREGDTICQS